MPTFIARRLPRILLLLTSGIGTLAPLAAQPWQSAESQVNSFTPGNQRRPAIASGADGAFVVVWQGPSPIPGDPAPAIVARRFDATGTPMDVETSITDAATAPAFPAVAMAAGGQFVVAWNELVGYEYGYARVFDDAGAALGPEVDIENSAIAVALDAQQRFIVSWNDTADPSATDAGSTIRDATGTLTGPVIGLGAEARTFDNAARRDDTFLVVWRPATADRLVMGRYDATSQLVGESTVSEHPAEAVAEAIVATDPTDGAVVAWRRLDQNVLLLRRFDASGMPLGAVTAVETGGPYDAAFQRADLAINAGGDVLVAWRRSDDDATTPHRVEAALFDAEGEQRGRPFTVSTAPSATFDAAIPRVAATRFDFVVVWASEQSVGTDTDGTSIHVRRVAGFHRFRDGFESGDLSLWDEAVP